MKTTFDIRMKVTSQEDGTKENMPVILNAASKRCLGCTRALVTRTGDQIGDTLTCYGTTRDYINFSNGRKEEVEAKRPSAAKITPIGNPLFDTTEDCMVQDASAYVATTAPEPALDTVFNICAMDVYVT